MEAIMSFDTALGAIGQYVLVISAVALGVERIMDAFKLFAKKYLKRRPRPERKEGESTDAFQTRKDRFLTEDGSRQQWVRFLAILIGIILAIVAQVDTFNLLGMPSPLWFGVPILGWVLSGLAASRGSAFWHDVIELVKTVKEAKREIVAKKGSS